MTQNTDTSREAVERAICNPIIEMVNTGRSPTLDGCGAIIDTTRDLLAERDALTAANEQLRAERDDLSARVVELEKTNDALCASVASSYNDRQFGPVVMALKEAIALTDELCEAIDCQAEGVGGQRKPLTILQEIGPKIADWRKVIPTPIRALKGEQK